VVAWAQGCPFDRRGW